MERLIPRKQQRNLGARVIAPRNDNLLTKHVRETTNIKGRDEPPRWDVLSGGIHGKAQTKHTPGGPLVFTCGYGKYI